MIPEDVRSRPLERIARLREAVPLDERDRLWLGLSLLPGFVAVAVYLATNSYPAYGAGLYVQIAATIGENGFAPPAFVSGYAVPVRFAYPPLQFYVLAALLDLGFDPLTVTRFLPAVGVVAGLIPAYLLGRDYTGSRAAGTATAAMIALNPQVLEWHVSAGGVVRAFAFLYALTAVYAGYHVFTDGGWRATAVGVVAVALTGLTHPTYALFVVSSYLVLWVGFDRSLRGFARGIAVGLGAVALASPWIAWVLTTHGPDAFTAAAGTHGGIGGGVFALLAGEGTTHALVAFAAAVAAFVVRRDAVIAGWTVVVTLLFYQARFGYAVAALAVAVVGVGIAERAANGGETPGALATPERRATVAAVLVILASVGGGAALAAEMTLVTDPTTPSFVDEDSVAAAEWAATETPDDATFVVIGDAAEWFPALSDRTILIGPWGVEWASTPTYDRQLDAFEDISACKSRTCVETVASSVDADPDYVVIPKGRYTVRGDTVVQFGVLERSFERSSWELAYENDGVVVYRATD